MIRVQAERRFTSIMRTKQTIERITITSSAPSITASCDATISSQTDQRTPGANVGSGSIQLSERDRGGQRAIQGICRCAFEEDAERATAIWR